MLLLEMQLQKNVETKQNGFAKKKNKENTKHKTPKRHNAFFFLSIRVWVPLLLVSGLAYYLDTCPTPMAALGVGFENLVSGEW